MSESKSKGYNEYLTAKVLFLKEKEEEALSHANSAMKLGLSLSEEAEMRQLAGMVYYAREDFSNAEIQFKKALELDEKSDSKLYVDLYGITYQDLARIYENRGDLQRALEYLGNLIVQLQTRYDPSKAKRTAASALCELAVIYLSHRNELRSAEEHSLANLKKAIEVDPDFPDPYAYLGVLFGSKELSSYDAQKAIGYYEHHLALSSADDPKRRISQENVILLKKEISSKEEPKRGGFFKRLLG